MKIVADQVVGEDGRRLAAGGLDPLDERGDGPGGRGVGGSRAELPPEITAPTPHIAGGTQYEGNYLIDIFSKNLDKFLANDLPLNKQVDMKQGF